MHFLFFQLVPCRALFNFRQNLVGVTVLWSTSDELSYVSSRTYGAMSVKWPDWSEQWPRGDNKWKWSGKTLSEQQKKKKKPRHLAIYQTVHHWIRVMCYEEEENIASRQFSLEKKYKSLYCITTVAQKDISKTYFDLFWLSSGFCTPQCMKSCSSSGIMVYISHLFFTFYVYVFSLLIYPLFL